MLILFISIGMCLMAEKSLAEEGKKHSEQESSKNLSKKNKEKLLLLPLATALDLMQYEASMNKDIDKLNQVIEKYNKLIQRIQELNWTEFIGSNYFSLGNAYWTKSWLVREKEDELMVKAIEYWNKALELNPDLKKQVEFNKKQYEWDKEHGTSFEEEYTNRAYDIWNAAKDKVDKSEEVDLGKAFKEAVGLLNRVIENNPEYENAYYWLGDIYFDRKMYVEAKEAYDKALELNPNDKYLHLSLAEYYLSQNQPKEAIKEAEKVLEIDPENVFAPDYIKKAR